MDDVPEVPADAEQALGAVADRDLGPATSEPSRSRRKRRQPTQKPRSKMSEAMKRKWQDPEFRAKQEKVFAARRADKTKAWSRLGVPDGMTRATAEAAWAEARLKARQALQALKAAGYV